MISFLKKVLYYGTLLPPIINTIRIYIKATQELNEQLKILNQQIDMQNKFDEDNSDD